METWKPGSQFSYRAGIFSQEAENADCQIVPHSEIWPPSGPLVPALGLSVEF